MKRVLAVLIVLTGGIAAMLSVLQKHGSDVLKTGGGVCGVIGDPDKPTGFFVISKAVPLVLSNLFLHFFGSVSLLSMDSLLHRAKRG